MQDAGSAETTSQVKEPCGKFAVCCHNSTLSRQNSPVGLSSCVVSQHIHHSSGSLFLTCGQESPGTMDICHPSFHPSQGCAGPQGQVVRLLPMWAPPMRSQWPVFLSLHNFFCLSLWRPGSTVSCELCFPYPQVLKKVARHILLSTWITVQNFINCLWAFLVML